MYAIGYNEGMRTGKGQTGRQAGWQGHHWMRPSTRLAIYLRDGLACAWCGAAVEDGALLTLDHCLPVNGNGQDNRPSNLVTACKRCNSTRQDRPMAEFAHAVAGYLDGDATPESVLRHLRNIRKRRLPREEARRMLALRGTVARVIKA